MMPPGGGLEIFKYAANHSALMLLEVIAFGHV